MDAKKIKQAMRIFAMLFLCGSGFVVFAQSGSESAHTLFLDADQDGLSNDEEAAYGTDPNSRDTDGDGYSDYTEVQSGYDPMKPAPGDKLVEESATAALESAAIVQEGQEGDVNMTQEAAAQIAGILSSSDVQYTEVTLDSINQLIQDMFSKNSPDAIVLPEIDKDSIKIKKQDYDDLSDEDRAAKEKEDATEYLIAFSYIISSNMPQELGGDVQVLVSDIITNAISSYTAGEYAYIEDLSSVGEKVMEQLRDVKVPENMVDMHIQGLQLAQYTMEMKDRVKPNADDPIGNIAALSQVQGLLGILEEFSVGVEKQMNDLGIYDIPGQSEE